ncbi:MAG: 30S ribosomal protein S8e [Candidatus Pacearchaeota archaeon]|nr:30S ribosomal protein S8e [Candidatus Pacearchaeota archaeon]
MRLGRKITGGRYIKRMKKKKHSLPGQRRVVKLSKDEKRKDKRVRGGNKKNYLLKAKFVNIQEKGKKSKKAEIKNVLETPSNKFLARQNVLTKGTIVQTDLGKVKITNRPAQESMINGVLIE